MARPDLKAALRERILLAADRARTWSDRLLVPDATSGLDQWQRVVLNEAVERHLRSLDPGRLTAAEISGDARAGLGWRQFTSLNYPEFDLCAPLGEQGTFDVVICEQVIEHVVDPGAAARNLRDLCTSGGRVIVSTPFLIRVHELPMFGMHDYWRFTPRGLRTLLESAGLMVDEVGAWGNRDCVVANFERWPTYRRWQSLRNEPDLPVQVWAFAHRSD